MGALLTLVDKDAGLKNDKEKLALFKSLAQQYDKDILTNLGLTSLDLDSKYSTYDPIAWRDFLNYAPIRKMVEGFLNEKAEKESLIAVGRPMETKDGVRVKKEIDAQKKGGDNANFVVMFLPRKNYED